MCTLASVGLPMQWRVKFIWWEMLLTMRDVWKYITTAHGEQCVIMAGIFLMPMWFAVSSVIAEPQLHLDKPSLVKAKVQSTMTMSPAMGQSHSSLNAPIMALEFTIVATVKTQAWSVLLHVSWMLGTCLLMYADFYSVYQNKCRCC